MIMIIIIISDGAYAFQTLLNGDVETPEYA